jgi:hypothetical protein
MGLLVGAGVSTVFATLQAGLQSLADNLDSQMQVRASARIQMRKADPLLALMHAI